MNKPYQLIDYTLFGLCKLSVELNLQIPCICQIRLILHHNIGSPQFNRPSTANY